MASSFTNLLGLILPTTGELSGTWGDTINGFLTQYLDSAIAGVQNITGSQTAVTLQRTAGATLVQVGTGDTGSSQFLFINCTGTPATTLTITAPASSKFYVVANNTATNKSVKLVGTGPTTGVTLEPLERAIVGWIGTDFVKLTSANPAQTFALLTASQTFTGRNVFPSYDLDLSKARALKGQELRVSSLGGVAGSVTIDLSEGNIYTATLTAATTFSFTNVPGANQSQVVILRLTNGGAFVVTWPAGTKYVGGAAPTLTAAGTDYLAIYYDTVTATYWVNAVGKDVK